MKQSVYRPGGDAKAIADIAQGEFGGFEAMFEQHGWPERGSDMMRHVQSRVAETYGGVAAFEAKYCAAPIMAPIEAITSPEPNVWLTSFYGFGPDKWGLLAFTTSRMRNSFIKRSRPGVLVVVFGASPEHPMERGRILGIQQCSHQLGDSEEFITPEEWAKKQQDPENAGRWNFGVKATRAWQVKPASRISVAEFAPETYSKGRARIIGALGMPLKSHEALGILGLQLEEVSVYGEPPVAAPRSGPAQELLAPSKPGPVSQSPFIVPEAEGPKHLYILALAGDTDAFLGRESGGSVIVKAGFSGRPQSRCDVLNSALPRGAFHWEILYAGDKAGFEPHPTSSHALAGEQAIQQAILRANADASLGHEFFLTTPASMDAAWNEGNAKARSYRP